MLLALDAAPSVASFSHVPFAQGVVEEIGPLYHRLRRGPINLQWLADRHIVPPRAVRVRGWMLMPDGPFDRIHAFVNGKEFFSGVPEYRPDIAATFPHIPDAGNAQFNFQIPRRVARRGRLVLLGKRQGRSVGRMNLRFRNDLHLRIPMPPIPLALRVVDTGDFRFFLANGYKSFGEMYSAIDRHRPVRGVQRVLDWGCGCGRLTVHWLRQRKVREVHGCDIDSEAIDWCRANLPGGTFTTVAFDPPTPYPDSMFDAVTAYSVLTHLRAPSQIAWLEEMRRILKPGGIIAASVHGPSAAWFAFGQQSKRLVSTGIDDSTAEHELDSMLGTGVYRDTYQTPEYTRKTFGAIFECLEYVERGVGNCQDLVIGRKRS